MLVSANFRYMLVIEIIIGFASSALESTQP